MAASYSSPSSPRTALQQWAIWVALSAIGLFLGFAFAVPIATVLSRSVQAASQPYTPTLISIAGRAILLGALYGLPYGIAQWLFLRSLRGLGLWAPATALTFPFVGVLVVLVALGPPITAKPISPSLSPGSILSASLFSIPMATLQWLLLRRHFRQAGWWIPTTYVAWLVAALAANVIPIDPPLDHNVWSAALRSAPNGLILGGVQAALTGVLLLSLRHRIPVTRPGA